MSGCDPLPSIRIDKWLWQARFFKTRSLSAKTVAAGHVRVNGVKTSKPAASLRPGDVLTFPQADTIRVIEIVACGDRRGPAPEAQSLYLDRAPPTPKPKKLSPENPRFEGKGRPTKKSRRKLDLSRDRPLE